MDVSQNSDDDVVIQKSDVKNHDETCDMKLANISKIISKIMETNEKAKEG